MADPYETSTPSRGRAETPDYKRFTERQDSTGSRLAQVLDRQATLINALAEHRALLRERLDRIINPDLEKAAQERNDHPGAIMADRRDDVSPLVQELHRNNSQLEMTLMLMTVMAESVDL